MASVLRGFKDFVLRGNVAAAVFFFVAVPVNALIGARQARRCASCTWLQPGVANG